MVELVPLPPELAESVADVNQSKAALVGSTVVEDEVVRVLRELVEFVLDVNQSKAALAGSEVLVVELTLELLVDEEADLSVNSWS